MGTNILPISLIGHHATHTHNVESILENGFAVSPSDSFVGSGVYFWENNKGLAHWWGRERRLTPYAIIQASIQTTQDRFLDLHSRVERLGLLVAARELSKRLGMNPSKTRKRLGYLVNMVSKFAGEPYDVVRGIYPAYMTRPAFRNDDMANVKIILAVRNTRCITEPSVVD